MQLFYNPELDDSITEFTVSKEESRHIVKVLRMKAGDALNFTNGAGWQFECTILKDDDKRSLIGIDKKHFHSPRPFSLNLAVAPTKMNDRYEWFLEKVTEIGVETITPLICEHSERKQIKVTRMQKIIESAMKQSNRFFLPKLNEAISFKEFIMSDQDAACFIAHCHRHDLLPLKSKLNKPQSTTILIGPEGDFSVKEIEMALEGGYIPVNLGQSRLRTETAAIVACHTVALAYD
ncbi:MAG: 16S rRNA (uracil(1498)-N(3))-methyltransferase [Flavobacteriaceae bacterium]|nr:16S rRNA (uracil(1498)-N(3))-methyltransferase [Bacteroidia bacterium]MBT8287032.1 16S rRNA (uracil(1498)-N(3))-methyltransferase [Bacteroidia bacterium]NNF76345.1 16S rRNA (uracil(1498)-N(3))-methyltransferase [Flavobacteriaceae bacterium]NNK72755.1 16S rRNA (uracil(1498)-N(3))-methyltransferase [Flavobacteriaceae bacterium]